MMNDGKALAGGSIRATVALPGDDGLRRDEASLEEWAAILASAGLPKAQPARLPGAEDPAAGWRAGDGGLTQKPRAESDDATDGNAESVATHVDLRVDGADLGELSIAVDRLDTGVRVTISACDDRGVRALEPERIRLLHVLTESGVRVDSVTVVRTDRSGTALAQGTTRATDDPAEPRPEPGRDPRRRFHKKSHFIG